MAGEKGEPETGGAFFDPGGGETHGAGWGVFLPSFYFFAAEIIGGRYQ
jgi:hypothetical protein